MELSVTVLFCLIVATSTAFPIDQKNCNAITKEFKIIRLMCIFKGNGVYDFDGFKMDLSNVKEITFDKFSTTSLVVLRNVDKMTVKFTSGGMDRVISADGLTTIYFENTLCYKSISSPEAMKTVAETIFQSISSTESMKTAAETNSWTSYGVDGDTTSIKATHSLDTSADSFNEEQPSWFIYVYPILIAIFDLISFFFLVILLTIVDYITFPPQQPLPQHLPAIPQQPQQQPNIRRYPQRRRKAPNRLQY